MRVRLLAFASARQALGHDEVEIELEDGSRVGDLARLLETNHPALAAIWPRLAIAVNGRLVDGETALTEGAEVALLPPVSGGAAAARTALSDEAIDLNRIVEAVSQPRCGAVLLFTGNVRERNRGREVLRITYHAYRRMAATALERIAAELEDEATDIQVRIVHRIGEIPAGETSVAIAVASPHRQSAYLASRRALERLKREVPIWKLEHYADGTTDWREEEPLAGSVPDLVERREDL